MKDGIPEKDPRPLGHYDELGLRLGVECSEYTRKEARQRFKEYVENCGDRCMVRLEKHREKIEEVA